MEFQLCNGVARSVKKRIYEKLHALKTPNAIAKEPQLHGWERIEIEQ